MTTVRKPMITDLFVEGARKGWVIATTSTLPSVIMAFVIMKALDLTGALDLIGVVLAPVMMIFGLPGEAATVLLAAWLSMAGAVGVAISLFDGGLLNGDQIAILTPAIFLVGSQVQLMGRVLGAIGIDGRYIPVMIIISYISSFGSMFVMRLLI